LEILFLNRTANSSWLAGLCVFLSLTAPARAQLTADAQIKPPHIELDQVFPDTLMQSDSYRVEDTLRLKGTLFAFTIDSNHGRYDVLSIPMAILRIHEIRTLAQAVDAYQRDSQQLAAELRGVIRVGGDSAVDILTSPIATTKSVVNQFVNNNIRGTVNEINNLSDPKVRRVRDPNNEPDVTTSIYDGLVPADPILAAYKRSIASQLDLDVYSSNTRVQAFLDILARERAGGNTKAGLITVSLPQRPEISVDKGRIAFEVRTAIARKTIRELYMQNETALSALGIKPELYHAFLSHRAFSPTLKTEITAYLVYMKEVANRGAMLQAALRATDEVSALGYARMARMLAYYHESAVKLKTLVSGGSVLMATTVENNMVLVLPFDLLWWNSESEQVFTSLAKFADDNGFSRRELLQIGVTGTSARKKLEQLKFTTREKYLLSH
jgi:hypothetical protein